jgi:hypothetical protein
VQGEHGVDDAAGARARLERFPATHAPHLERPDDLEATVEAFLGEIGWAPRDSVAA